MVHMMEGLLYSFHVNRSYVKSTNMQHGVLTKDDRVTLESTYKILFEVMRRVMASNVSKIPSHSMSQVCKW